MAFCNSCGGSLGTGVRFCPKCGAAAPDVAGVSASTPLAPPAQPQNSNVLKVVLIVVAAILVVGALGVGTATFIAMRIARHSRIENRDGSVRVQTPFGS